MGCADQRPAAALPTGVREDRHPECEHAGHALLNGDVSDLAALVVFEDPYARRIPALDDLPQWPGALVDVDRRLRRQGPLLRDDRQGAGRVDDVVDPCAPDVDSHSPSVVHLSD